MPWKTGRSEPKWQGRIRGVGPLGYPGQEGPTRTFRRSGRRRPHRAPGPVFTYEPVISPQAWWESRHGPYQLFRTFRFGRSLRIQGSFPRLSVHLDVSSHQGYPSPCFKSMHVYPRLNRQGPKATSSGSHPPPIETIRTVAAPGTTRNSHYHITPRPVPDDNRRKLTGFIIFAFHTGIAGRWRPQSEVLLSGSG